MSFPTAAPTPADNDTWEPTLDNDDAWEPTLDNDDAWPTEQPTEWPSTDEPTLSDWPSSDEPSTEWPSTELPTPDEPLDDIYDGIDGPHPPIDQQIGSGGDNGMQGGLKAGFSLVGVLSLCILGLVLFAYLRFCRRSSSIERKGYHHGRKDNTDEEDYNTRQLAPLEDDWEDEASAPAVQLSQ